MEREILEELVGEGLSTRGIADEVGLSQTTIRYWLRKYNIRTVWSTGERAPQRSGEIKDNPCAICGSLTARRNTYCSIGCANEATNQAKLGRWLEGDMSVLPSNARRTGVITTWARRYILERADSKCERCGWDGLCDCTDSPVLQIHHIDHDYTNLSPNNLEVICPNCHALHHACNPVDAGQGRRANGGF